MKRMVNVPFCWCTGYDCTVLWRREKGYTLNGEISDVKNGMVYLKKYSG